MAMSINTNIASLTAQRNLGRTQGMLNKSLARLSSGLRINSAKDDAAGLAISNRMTSQIRGLNQAARNANDGISLAQTADGALNESTNIIQRLREIAVQSANDTNTASDRASLQAEVDQMVEELDRIASTTSFNGKNVIDGSLSNASFQVGANSGQQISFSIAAAGAKDIGQLAIKTGGAVTSTAFDGTDTYQINGETIANSSDYVNGSNGKTSDSALAKALAINGSITGVRAEAQTTTLAVAMGDDLANKDHTLTLNGVVILDGTATTALTKAEVADQINVHSSTTGVSAVVTAGGISMSASDGRNIDITVAGGTGPEFTVATTRSAVKLVSASNITLSAGANTVMNMGGVSIAVDANSLTSLDVTTVTTAGDAIDRLDAALSSIDTIRGGLGAVQNRFESTIANLQNVSENISAARSRILDADFAAETAALTKAQVLQQAGVAMLAQANMMPQAVLSLLQ